MKRNLKKDFFRVALEEAKGDSSKVWKAVERAYNSVTRKKSKIVLNGVEDPLSNAEVLNSFFSDIGPKLDDLLGPDPNVITETVVECNPLILQPVSEAEIRKIVINLSLNVASGDDGFSPKIIKAALPVFVPIITALVNKSIRSKVVPNKWKHACITPIYKSGDKGEPNKLSPN